MSRSEPAPAEGCIVDEFRRAADRLLASYRVATTARGVVPVAVALSPREVQVLQGLARGLTTIGIGQELYLSRDTIKTHCTRIYQKLGAQTGAHAVAIGYQAGLLELPEVV